MTNYQIFIDLNFDLFKQSKRINQSWHLIYNLIRKLIKQKQRKMLRYTIIQEPIQSKQTPRQPRRLNYQSQEQYVERLRQILEMNGKNNQYYLSQTGTSPKLRRANLNQQSQRRYATEKEDNDEEGVMYLIREDENQNDTVHLPKIRKKNKVAKAIRYSQIDSNDKLIIRNYMNAKLVQFKRPSKKSKKKRNYTVDKVGELPQNIDGRKYYTYKTRTPVENFRILQSNVNQYPKYLKNPESSRTESLQRFQHRRMQSHPSISQTVPNGITNSRYENNGQYLSRSRPRLESTNGKISPMYKFVDSSSPENKNSSGYYPQVNSRRKFYDEPNSHHSLDHIDVNNYSGIINKQSAKKKEQGWELVDPLNLQTYFVKMKKVAAISPDPSKMERPKIKIATIPARQDFSKFIKNYVPEFDEIKIEQLIRNETFQIIQDESNGRQNFYFGETKNDQKNGKGILITDKYTFQGIWSFDSKIRGIQITQSGKYKGQFKDGQRYGKGQFFWSHGQYYSGEWKNGKKNGSGYWKSLKGESYMGQWKNGQVTGYGVHIMKSGQKYEGQFVNFLKHGFGKEQFPNGDHYEGRYVQGQPHGSGKYYWKNETFYSGDFIQGYREGKGTIIAPNQLQFEGNFKNDIITGVGRLKFSNGDVYNGMFQNNKKNGHGILDMKSQKRIIKGIWSNNQLLREQQ